MCTLQNITWPVQKVDQLEHRLQLAGCHWMSYQDISLMPPGVKECDACTLC